MAFFTIQSLIDRAKVYADEDHEDDSGWIAPAIWLRLAVTEIAEQHRRWVRAGHVIPAQATASVTGTAIGFDVLAIVAVYYDDGTTVRLLDYAGPSVIRSATQPEGDAYRWWMESSGDSVTVLLDPQPSTYDNYYIRYVPQYPVNLITSATDQIELPSGMDERVVLGIARRAHIKDSGASSLIERLIAQSDAELAFGAAARTGGLSVKTLPRFRPSPYSTPNRVSWPNRLAWLYV